ncbi:MAG: GreA/GreB family elongation factor [Eubacteriales bacterium]|jgi:transcription elongation factor GreA
MHDKLTRSDIKKMQEEIDQRTLVDRPRILKEIQEARAQGDLSENFEYYAARKANRENNSRINYLTKMIETAIIIEDRMDEDQAGINKRVTFSMPGRPNPITVKIVTTVRADSLEGKITPESPVGKALMGHRTGDICHVKVSDDIQYDLKILKVENPGEEASDTLRKF